MTAQTVELDGALEMTTAGSTIVPPVITKPPPMTLRSPVQVAVTDFALVLLADSGGLAGRAARVIGGILAGAGPRSINFGEQLVVGLRDR